MTVNLGIPKEFSDLKPRIAVVGVGGAGGNAVNNMIRANLIGCEFIACNTDAQALQHSLADRKIQLGQSITQGLGAGARPEVGRQAAEESLEEILAHFQGANMVFVTAGMGGGTGTGAAPLIAKAAREAGLLTVGVVTKPFHFEGTHRMRLAESGIEELQKFVDTLLIIPNQNLFRVANERTTFAEAFKMADDVLHAGVRGVTDLMMMPGLINLDFADIRTVMSEMGKAMMGTGEASGDRRAIDAAEAAISNPLLDDVSMRGARGVLVNITGGNDMTLYEVDEAMNRVKEEVDPEANIVFGSTLDEKLQGKIRISVVATGIDAEVAKLANVLAGNTAGPRLMAVNTTPAASVAAAAAMPSQAAPAAAAPAFDFVAAALRQASPPDTTPRIVAAAPQPAEASSDERHGEVVGGNFVPPRPVLPQTRVATGLSEESATLETIRATQPREQAARPASSGGGNFLKRLFSGADRQQRPVSPTPGTPRTQPQGPQATARMAPVAGPDQSPISTGIDELDIPAFLRRQAN
jgi:cell division protein FtsZ